LFVCSFALPVQAWAGPEVARDNVLLTKVQAEMPNEV